MSFGQDFDFSYDSIYNHVQSELSHLAQFLPPEVMVPTFDDVAEDVAFLDDLDAIAREIPQVEVPTPFTLPHDGTFDFGGVQPHRVEQHGPDFSTVTETWNHDTSSHTGTGSQSWSNSGSFADAFPKPVSTKTA